MVQLVLLGQQEDKDQLAKVVCQVFKDQLEKLDQPDQLDQLVHKVSPDQ
jgi:hypothetical protein